MLSVFGASRKVAASKQIPKQHTVVMTSCSGPEADVQANWQRVMSICSSGVEGQQAVERIIVDNRSSGLLQLAKMLAVVAIPVIALLAVCSLQLSSAIDGFNVAYAATGAFQEFLRLDKLVTGVQLERGMSAAWVSSRGRNVDVRRALMSLWAHNDDALQSLTRWPTSGLHVADKTFHFARQLSHHINGLRGVVVSAEIAFTDEIKEYTAITNALMSWSLTVIVTSSMSTIWSMIVSNAALLLASDVIGIQRALGSVFFTCFDEFNKNETEWFFENDGAADALLSFASGINDDVSLMYSQRYVDSDLHKNVSSLKKVVGGLDLTFNCTSFDTIQRFDNVQFWKVRYYFVAERTSRSVT